MSRHPSRTPPRSRQDDDLPPPIYAAPTTETLGDDESLLIRPYAVQTPTRYRRPLSSASDTPQTRPGGRARSNLQPIRSGSTATVSTTATAAETSSSKTTIVDKTAFVRNSFLNASNHKPRRRRRRSRHNNKNEFQHPEDLMRVSVQTVHLAQRSAFDIQPALPLAEWHKAAEKQHGHTRRISPSLQHLELLHKLQSITMIRQVQFSPSVGRDDVWDPPPLAIPLDQQQQQQADDGRYRAIHAVQAAVSALPTPAPVLSHKKRRQPMRADVGFPNATPQEMLQKQEEIRNETAWEESSPRLAVLVTSDDLGMAVVDDSISTTVDPNAAHPWKNGGGWPGIPHAGRELLEALTRNAQHFGKQMTNLPSVVKPNPYSMLAPPLDASYSPSQGWRPRPFHDRPAGMQYFLACPLQVQVNQPGAFLCRMALYTISSSASGKISEDFYFPAGDWSGQAPFSESGEFWKRKRKAIFSYDPLELPAGKDSLFLVLRIYQKHSDVSPLWKPMSFGITEACPSSSNGDYQWPSSVSLDMKMYSEQGFSHETFLDQLFSLTHSEGQPAAEHPQDTDDSSFSSGGESGKKRSVVGRLFRSPMKPSKSRVSVSTRSIPQTPLSSSTRSIPLSSSTSTSTSSCTLFLSNLSVDFLQSMLTTPSELREGQEGKTPRLLVDVSGDFAVVLEEDETHQQNLIKNSLPPSSSGAVVKKRSSLLRLPRAPQPAGYAASSEFREILPLPVGRGKSYEFDSPLSYRSIQNLLFLYPRMLRLEHEDGKKLNNLTVRIRAMHTESVADGGKTVDTALQSFHSTAPWSTGSLVDEVFTSVSSFPLVCQGGDSKPGVSFSDEFKLRLPLLLDGTFSLLVSFFELSNSNMILVAETSIPLSSSAPREGTSGGRIATVIPNGNHRLKLGSYQLRIETRLVSSVHLGDPSVAVLLRDFPHSSVEDSGLKSFGQLLGTSSSGLKADFFAGRSSVISGASESAVAAHFHALMYLHLWNLVNPCDVASTSGMPAFLSSNMRSLFELLDKLKARQALTASPGVTRDSTLAFFKKFLDAFDEAYLSPSNNWSDRAAEVSIESASTEMHLGPSASQDEDNESDPGSNENDGAAVRIRKVSSARSDSEMRVTRIVRALGPSNVPFSRVAYGATKTDRMRLEAELYNEESFDAPFFDDDETIATAPSIYTDVRKVDMAVKNLGGTDAHEGKTSEERGSHNSILKSATDTFTVSSAESHIPHKNSGETEFATRVKTAAQVMLAPCVGPSFSSILSGKTSPRRSNEEEITRNREAHASSALAKPSFSCCPGSDAEYLSSDASSRSKKATVGGSVLRGAPDAPVLEFSIRFKQKNEVPVGCGKYIYESVVVLWLRSWLDHVEERLRDSATTGHVATFEVPEYDPGKTPMKSIYCFYGHMDYLLPLCLKSIVLRYSVEVLPSYPPSTKVILDNSHMLVLEPFVELLARGLVGQALSGLGSLDGRDKSVLRVLASSELVLDFLVGLLALVHPQHMNTLLTKYFYTLRECETEHLGAQPKGSDFRWNEENLHRVRSCRQLRIRAVEVFASLPSFLAMNYPLKFSGSLGSRKSVRTSWVKQYNEIKLEPEQGERSPIYKDGIERLPKSGWLAELVIGEGLSVCALSCEAVVAEAMAHSEVSRHDSSSSPLSKTLRKRPGAALKRDDLLMFQSLGIHAITAVYELVLRRHAMDQRYQTDSSRGRIAALFAKSMLSKSLASVRWLARMESTHKIRSIWLLCFVYVLQEAPEVMVRDYVRSCCNPEDMRIHRFIRLLRLCSSTFQSFIDLHKHATFPSDIGMSMSPWLLQESFNTICVAINVVVEECVKITSSYPKEQERMMQGLLDLLLHVLTTPQSSVTHLRAVGGALQALEQFGVTLFLQISGTNLQHWIRVILSLMNSVSLSVRSIAVDFVVSLLGNAYEMEGNIDDLAVVFVSVLPEVAAREIGLFSVGGLVASVDDVAQTLWPLRRSLADLEDANPLDDSRVDPELPHILKRFCRACQAVIDGVLIELRLNDNKIIGTQVSGRTAEGSSFDADEESLYEAADFFLPETGPLQRIRWLSTLQALHEAKGQWVEAAETAFLCAHTATDSIPHLRSVWRPSRFVLWSDARRSLWLETVGEDIGLPDRGNAQVMDFADEFLEPSTENEPSTSSTGQLLQPTLPMMCRKLIEFAKGAVNLYLREEGMDELAYARLEFLQKALALSLEVHTSRLTRRGISRGLTSVARKRHLAEEAELRKVLASISGDMTRLAERLLLIAQNEPTTPEALANPHLGLQKRTSHRPCFVLLRFSGKKPARFQESTTLPTFVEWDTPCVCRVSRNLADSQTADEGELAHELCLNFARPFVRALQGECGMQDVVLNTDPTDDFEEDYGKTVVHVFPIEAAGAEPSAMSSLVARRFLLRKTPGKEVAHSLVVEMTVALKAPCALSRQRILLQTESIAGASKSFFTD